MNQTKVDIFVQNSKKHSTTGHILCLVQVIIGQFKVCKLYKSFLPENRKIAKTWVKRVVFCL